MITHVIYHIPGRKVGCTKDLEGRRRWYKQEEGVILVLDVLEELHDKTDQEAGDIEWQWADRLGYKRGPHYAVILEMSSRIGSLRVATSEEQREYARRSSQALTPERIEASRNSGRKLALWRISNMTPEQRRDSARKASLKGARKGGLIQAAGMTFEQLSERGKRAQRRAAELGGLGCQIRTRCPHCGLESNRAILGRWHFDRCLQKPTFTRGN